MASALSEPHHPKDEDERGSLSSDSCGHLNLECSTALVAISDAFGLTTLVARGAEVSGVEHPIHNAQSHRRRCGDGAGDAAL
jgi:hypothetical protein